MRLAAAADAAAAGDSGERALLRIARRRSASTGSASVRRSLVAEALECLGGNGYVEENGLARLFRESPLNSVWEGSGNVIALDVLRVLRTSSPIARRPGAELDASHGRRRSAWTPPSERCSATLREALARCATDPQSVAGAARWLVERLAVAPAGVACWPGSARARSPTPSSPPASSARVAASPGHLAGRRTDHACHR